MSGDPITSPAPPDGSAAALAAGLAAFAAPDLEAAHAHFQRAHRRDPRWPRAMSWFGVTLVLVERNSALGVSLCDQAVRQAGPLPELALNQARVHLALNQRERAVRALTRGQEAAPGEATLAAALQAIGARRPPVLAFLARGNPLNRVLGRLRHRWGQRRAPAGPPSPLALGAAPEPAAPPRS